MKVCTYLENSKMLSPSGIGRAISHQKLALQLNGVEVTTNPKDSFDIIDINSYGPYSYHLMKKLQKKGYKVVVHGHSTHEDFKDSFRFRKLIQPFYNFMLNRMYKKADLIITPTNYSKSLIENYKNVTAKVIAISNGINLEEYKPNQSHLEAFKKYFNIKDGEKVVIGVGFYFKRKGIDDFIEVARSFPNVKFIWFGYLNKFLTSSYINKCLKNKPNNVILPGYIKGEIIKGAYNYASCMFFPSNEETEGIVCLEALASYCPLVIKDIPVFKDWLTDKVNCYKGHSNKEFVDIISKLLESKDENIVNNGYIVASQKEIKKIGEQLKKAYIEALEYKD